MFKRKRAPDAPPRKQKRRLADRTGINADAIATLQNAKHELEGAVQDERQLREEAEIKCSDAVAQALKVNACLTVCWLCPASKILILPIA